MAPSDKRVTRATARRLSVEPLESRRLLAASSLDPTWGTAGIVTTPIGTGNERIEASALQSDGKLIVAGSTTNVDGTKDVVLVRYSTTGTLDTTFDVDGKVVTALSSSDDVAYDIAIDTLGRYVVVGSTTGGDGTQDMFVARYQTTGALDVTFGTLGVSRFSFTFSGNDVARGVALDTSGRIVVVGETRGSDGSQDMALARLLTGGTLDGAFGIGGRTTTAITRGDDVAEDVLIDSSGRITAIGSGFGLSNTRDFALARFNTSGTPDGTFGLTGQVTTHFGFGDDAALDAAFDSSGRIVVGGYAIGPDGTRDFAVARYSSSGVADSTFDTDGRNTASFTTLDDSAYGLALDSAGRIVLGGFATISTNTAVKRDFALARFTTAGALDTNFDSDGRVTTAVSTDHDEIHSLRIDSSDRIVASGYAVTPVPLEDLAVARYGDGLTIDGTTLTVTGTSNADTLRIEFTSTTAFTATLNGRSTNFTVPTINRIVLNGAGGTDTATVVGPTTVDTVTLQPALISITGANYTLSGSSLETVYYYGGATDIATLVDSTGADAYYGLSSTSLMAGTGYLSQVIGPQTVYAYAINGGTDVGYLYDTAGDNTLYAQPTTTLMTAAGYLNQTVSFDAVYSSTSTGYDVAVATGSTGADTFYATPTTTFLTGTGYYNLLTSFDAVYADGAGGTDTAALLGSAGNDAFIGLSNTSILYGTGFYYQATAFAGVTSIASGGVDTAVLYDSTGSDFLRAESNYGLIVYAAGYISAVGFDFVTANSSLGGTDTRRVAATDYVLTTVGPWIDV